MNCCFIFDHDRQNIYANQSIEAKAKIKKNKFSFRTTASTSMLHSRVSSPQHFNWSKKYEMGESTKIPNKQTEEEEIKQLEAQFRQLSEQNQKLNQMVNLTIPSLQAEVAHYEKQIIKRSYEIDELQFLLQRKLQEKQIMVTHQFIHPNFIKANQPFNNFAKPQILSESSTANPAPYNH